MTTHRACSRPVLGVAAALLLHAAVVAAAPPRVRLVATGGTISNRTGGRLTATELLQSVPSLSLYAAAEAEQFSNVASSELTLDQWLDLARRLNEIFQRDPGLAGIVVTSGTDTLEELAYFLNLTVRDSRPVVLVGSMRNASAVGYEGPANLLAGFRVAGEPASRGRGVLVVLNDEINAAREVTKSDALRLHTFQSRGYGVLGVVDTDRVAFYRGVEKRHTAASEFDLAGVTALPRVDVVLVYQGASGDLIRAAADGGARGIVVAVAGAGATSGTQADGIDLAVRKGVVVVASTRTGGGRIPAERARPAGSPAEDRQAGASSDRQRGRIPIGAEDLAPLKARILLMLALTRTGDAAEIRRMFQQDLTPAGQSGYPSAATPMTRRNITQAYVGACLKNLQFFGPVAVPYFLDWLRVDYTRLFALQAWFLFWVFTLEIPTGIVADKAGRKFSVAAGCLLFGADMLLFGLSTSYPLLFVAEFLGAVGMTLTSGAEEALLYDTLVALGEQERARHYLSRCGAAGTLGLLIAFPVGSFVGALGRYPELLPVPFLMTAAAAVLAAIAYFTMKEPDRAKPTEGFLRMGVQGLRTLFAHPDLRRYVLNAVTISSVTFFAFWFYQPVSQRGGLRLAYVGLLAAGFNLFSTLLLANSSLVERLFGIRRLLIVTAAAPAVLFAVLAWTRSLWIIVPAFFALIGCKFVRAPVLSALINRHIESENRATVISSVSLVERLITFLLYPVVGGLADLSLDHALYLLAALCAVFAVATRLSERQLKVTGAAPAG